MVLRSARRTQDFFSRQHWDLLEAIWLCGFHGCEDFGKMALHFRPIIVT
jgi:hypothetical protein